MRPLYFIRAFWRKSIDKARRDSYNDLAIFEEYAMLLDIKRIFSTYNEPVHWETEVDCSAEDFPGYQVDGPVHAALTATLCGSVLELALVIRARVNFQCARCLEDSSREFVFEKMYPIREADFSDPDAELPFTREGRLDVKELCYSELVLEVPAVLLCSDSCAGLCPVCGCPKPCACTQETNGAAADGGLSILKRLLP